MARPSWVRFTVGTDGCSCDVICSMCKVACQAARLTRAHDVCSYAVALNKARSQKCMPKSFCNSKLTRRSQNNCNWPLACCEVLAGEACQEVVPLQHFDITLAIPPPASSCLQITLHVGSPRLVTDDRHGDLADAPGMQTDSTSAKIACRIRSISKRHIM